MPKTSFDRARQRITVSLFTAQSLFSAAMIAAFTVTPIVAAQLSGRDDAAGVPSTVNLVGRAALAYPIGWLMDRLGRRAGLSLGFLLGVLGGLLSVWAVVEGIYWLFLAGAAFMGGARASAEQSRYVAAEVHPAARRARIIGLIVSAGTVGAIGGPLLVDPAGRLAGRFGVEPLAGALVVATLFLIVALLIVVALLRPDPLQLSRQVEGDSQPAMSGAEPTATQSLGQVFRGAAAQVAVGAMLIGQLVMTMLMVITPLHMSHHDHNTQAISWVIMAHTLGMFGLSGLTGWLIDRIGRHSLIMAGSLLLVLSAVMAPLSTELPLLAVALFLLGLGWNFCFIAGSSLLANVLPEGERGRGQGASEVVVALASGAGSLGSGYLFAWGDIGAVSAAGIGLALLLAALVMWATLSPQRALKAA